MQSVEARISTPEALTAVSEDFIEQIAERAFEYLDLGLGDRNRMGPIVGDGGGQVMLGRPIAAFCVFSCSSRPAVGSRLEMVIDTIGVSPAMLRPATILPADISSPS
ncbi:MAG: hypothetical protein F8N37_05845 [Telmatospirillum sp.]|nr:hypothetical protein [Telmatospirillum sp.]